MDIEIVVVEISNTLDSIYYNLLRLISDERQTRIRKFQFDIDRKLSLYSELLVRYQACKKLKLTGKEILFKKNKYCKPYLLGYPKFQFNISHTRNAIAVSFSNSEIGIDIEQIKTADLAIVKRFFTNSEQDYISSHNNPDYAFYEVWTKKEAYIKCIGTGLYTPLTSFNVLDNMIAPMIHTTGIGKYLVSTCCRQITITKPNIITMTEPEMHILLDKAFNES